MFDKNMLMQLMKKKAEAGSGDMSPEYKDSKMKTLQALHGEMGKLMGGDLQGLKKVTVASPDEAGLSEGLDKAKELLKTSGGDGESHTVDSGSMDSENEQSGEPEDEMSEEDAMSPEELDAEINRLTDLKKSKSKKY